MVIRLKSYMLLLLLIPNRYHCPIRWDAMDCVIRGGCLLTLTFWNRCAIGSAAATAATMTGTAATSASPLPLRERLPLCRDPMRQWLRLGVHQTYDFIVIDAVDAHNQKVVFFVAFRRFPSVFGWQEVSQELFTTFVHHTAVAKTKTGQKIIRNCV